MERILLIVFIVLTLSACGNGERAASVAASSDEVADVVYTNGKIYTVNEARPWAEAVAIKGGKFLVVGSNTDVDAVTSDGTEVIDLGGKFALPGMIDVHTHGVDAHLPNTVRLSDANDLDQILAEVEAYVDAHPDQESIMFDSFGFGLFPGDNGPKELLDEIAPNTAVAILHQSGHAFWVNSKALDMAGITAETPDPPQGIIARKENGEPAGGLQEEAMRPIRKIQPPIPDEYVEQSAETAMGIFAAHGITATREAGVFPRRYAVMQRLEKDGKLKTRFAFAAHWQTTLIDVPPPNDEVREFLLENVGEGSDMLKLDSLKVYLDGVPASKTAFNKEAYLGEPDNFGHPLITAEELNAALIDYDTNGVVVMMHVLGDAATEMGMNAIAAARGANGDSGIRHHLSHSVIVDTADIERYAELGAVVDFSPFFAYPGPHHANHYAAMGEERVEKTWPVKSAMEAGAVVALATDYPVDQINPFVTMESAHTRMHPYGEVSGQLGANEAISREDAIKAYTINPAFILDWDDKIGSIEIGKLADLVILDANPLEVDAADLSEIRVEQTIFAGDVVYDASTDAALLNESEDLRLLAFANMKSTGHVCATRH